MQQKEKDLWKAEIQALKAQYYFELMRRYGPIILVPENIDAAASIEVMQQPRRPIDEVVKAIVDLCDLAIPKLPYYREQEQNHYAYFSKEGAAALKAMALLYAASPLFNGNKMMADMKNKQGERLFPEYDRNKWKTAAEAADEALKIAEEGGKELVQGSTVWPTSMLNTIRNIQQSCLDYDYANKEALLCVRHQRFTPPVFYHFRVPEEDQDYYDQFRIGGFGASMKMVEMFYTEHGLPLSEDKQWVASRYEKSRENDERYRNVVPLNEEVLSLHLRREPRFYADIAAHGTYWYKKTVGGGNEPLYCNCLQGQRMGTSSKNYDIQTPQNLTGYYIKKYAPLAFADGTHAGMENGTGNLMISNHQDYVQVRYADVLLMAAELGSPNAQQYFNMVRERAFKDKDGNTSPLYTEKQATKENIMRERQFEFAFEGINYYDLLRQGIDYAAAQLAKQNGVEVMTAGAPATISFNPQNFINKAGLMMVNTNQILLSDGVLKQNPGW